MYCVLLMHVEPVANIVLGIILVYWQLFSGIWDDRLDCVAQISLNHMASVLADG